MAYRRRYNIYDSQTVTVSLSWASLVGAYELKFNNPYGNWTKVKAIIEWIKMTIPYGERDYDDITHIWTIHEKYFTQLRDILNAIGSDFNVVILEKPIGGNNQVKFVPLDVYFQIFKTHSGTDISNFTENEFGTAKKIYFRTAMKLHPDKGGDPAKMTEFNESWDVIKERHFKILRVMEQTQ